MHVSMLSAFSLTISSIVMVDKLCIAGLERYLNNARSFLVIIVCVFA